jgi:hypothetical protein
MQKGRSVTAAAFLLSIVVEAMDRAFGLSLAPTLGPPLWT